MALTEVQPQQRFFRITCDTPQCGRSVHVTAADERGALHRVRELRFWTVEESGQWCPRHGGEERGAA